MASAQPVGWPSHHFALSGARATTPVSERLPNFNIEGLCKATAADDAAMGLSLPQPVENCVRDETAAKQQLAAIWEQNAGPKRDSCEAEAAIGISDSQSYVDLLSCMQMAGIAGAGATTTTLRGGSKTRNKK
ncbi:hypothetical protein AC630_20120 [Bradyrhizobium sp. AS23.2]|nr:hypothetical protein AC630_20120 [Bradyrhizobium sp. AS23.2]